MTVANEWLPPALRDSSAFGALMRAAFGDRVLGFEKLRTSAPRLSPPQLRAFYLKETRARRKRLTDNTPAIVARIDADTLPGTVCDVGCGTGSLLNTLHQRPGRWCVGVDLNVDRMTCRPGIALAEAVMEELPFADAGIDTVISTHTLEHTLNLPAAAAELRRVARRRLIVVVPRERPYRFGLNAHLHYFVYPWQLALVLSPRGDYRCERIGGQLYYCEDLG